MKNNSQFQKILVVAAHPDNEVLGCGGVIAKHAKLGDKIYCLFLGKGKSSRDFQDKSLLEKEQAVLEREAQKAAELDAGERWQGKN